MCSDPSDAELEAVIGLVYVVQDAAKTGWVIDVGEADFEADVLQRSQQVPVVIDFWAEWCGPRRQLGPLLERQAAERKGGFVLAKALNDPNVTLDAITHLERYIHGLLPIRRRGIAS